MNKYTEQEFTYKQVPVSYDGIARLDSIKGNTVVFNQHIQNGNFADSTDWVGNNASISVSSNVLTGTVTTSHATAGLKKVSNISFIANHQYLVSATVSCSVASDNCVARFFATGNDFTSSAVSISANTKKRVSWIITPTNSFSGAFYLYPKFSYSSPLALNSTFTYSNVVLIDLTQLADSRVTDYDSFVKYYPLPYYSFTQGELVSFNGNAIKTVGFNQWDEEWEVGNINSSTGQNEAVNTCIRSKNYMPLLPNTRYYFYGAKGNAGNVKSRFYDASFNYIGSSPVFSPDNAFTPPSDARYYRFSLQTAYGVTYKNDICINISSDRNGEYEPYKTELTSLPVADYFPTGLKSAGSVYDELTPSKAVTRVGSVTVNGGITSKDSQDKLFLLPSVSGIKNVAYTDVPNITSRFEAKDLTSARQSTVNAICQNGTSVYISLAGQSITTIADANTYLASNPLVFNYELATPTEADATDIFYKFYGDGTEEILPANGSTPTTSAFLGDITYYNTIESDVPYRKFWFVNSKGEEWSLTEKDFKAFLNNPSGLGFKKQIDMVRYGERAVKSNETYDFPTVQGELFFYDSANSNRYDKYHRFTRFLMDQPITLYYQIPVSFDSQIADVYSLDCEVTEVQKTESKPENLLRSTITINGLSFYIGDEITITGTGTSYTIENNGDFPVGFEIQIDGTSLKNPYFTLEQDGELYGEAKFDYFEIIPTSTFSNVYVNSNDGQQEIVLKQSGTILPNPLSYQDLSISNGNIYVTFVKLARGVSTLTIGKDSGTLSNVTIKYAPAYRSV